MSSPHQQVFCSLNCQAASRSAEYKRREDIQAGIRHALVMQRGRRRTERADG